MELSKQEYWSGLPFPPPGDFPNPGIELRSPALQVDFLSYEPPGKPMSIPRQQLWSDSGGQLTSQLNLEKGVRAQPLWMRKHICRWYLNQSRIGHKAELSEEPEEVS